MRVRERRIMALGFMKATGFFFFVMVFFLLSKSSAELIKALPGQPGNASFNQYSGYIETDAKHGRYLFYYFVEADSVDPLTRPLTLWLNGGPGCSSIGYGAFMEHGPFQPGIGGQLITNKYSWNLESNMLYVDTPIGVGFSYSNTDSDYVKWNDSQTAEDNLNFIVNWLEEFPKYKDSELYLTGESYAGHYIPQLASLIMEHNKLPNTLAINLKAIALGNPLLDLEISISAADYLWAHGVISDETLTLEKTVCNDTMYIRGKVHHNLSEECSHVFTIVAEQIGYQINRNDILLPLCQSSANAEQLKIKGEYTTRLSMVGQGLKAGDPCLEDKIFTYLNRPDVQKAIHANTTGLPYYWVFCGAGHLDYNQTNSDMNIIPVVADLIRVGIPIMLFSGDQDAKIPLTQTRIIANMLAQDLKLVPFTKYGPWFEFDKNRIGGWAQSFSAVNNGKNVTYLTYATVRGAAHEVPFTSPSQALTLFKAFLTGSSLPSAHQLVPTH